MTSASRRGSQGRAPQRPLHALAWAPTGFLLPYAYGYSIFFGIFPLMLVLLTVLFIPRRFGGFRKAIPGLLGGAGAGMVVAALIALSDDSLDYERQTDLQWLWLGIGGAVLGLLLAVVLLRDRTDVAVRDGSAEPPDSPTAPS